MKKEIFAMIAVGLFILAAVLDAVVKPLELAITSPYPYFVPSTLMLYPFSTASIVFKAIGLTISIVLAVNLMSQRFAQGGILLLGSGLLQLYALQDIATRTYSIPLEWSLSLSLAGMALIIPAILYFLTGVITAIHHSLNPYGSTNPDDQQKNEDKESE